MTAKILKTVKRNDGTYYFEILANGNFIIAFYNGGIVTFKTTDVRSKRYVDDLGLQLERFIKDRIEKPKEKQEVKDYNKYKRKNAKKE